MVEEIVKFNEIISQDTVDWRVNQHRHFLQLEPITSNYNSPSRALPSRLNDSDKDLPENIVTQMIHLQPIPNISTVAVIEEVQFAHDPCFATPPRHVIRDIAVEAHHQIAENNWCDDPVRLAPLAQIEPEFDEIAINLSNQHCVILHAEPVEDVVEPSPDPSPVRAIQTVQKIVFGKSIGPIIYYRSKPDDRPEYPQSSIPKEVSPLQQALLDSNSVVTIFSDSAPVPYDDRSLPASEPMVAAPPPEEPPAQPPSIQAAPLRPTPMYRVHGQLRPRPTSAPIRHSECMLPANSTVARRAAMMRNRQLEPLPPAIPLTDQENPRPRRLRRRRPQRRPTTLCWSFGNIPVSKYYPIPSIYSVSDELLARNRRRQMRRALRAISPAGSSSIDEFPSTCHVFAEYDEVPNDEVPNDEETQSNPE